MNIIKKYLLKSAYFLVIFVFGYFCHIHAPLLANKETHLSIKIYFPIVHLIQRHIFGFLLLILSVYCIKKYILKYSIICCCKISMSGIGCYFFGTDLFPYSLKLSTKLRVGILKICDFFYNRI